MVGDRWSLLIVRDMMLAGASSYADLLASHEGIATNILTDRLKKLARDGIIAAQRHPDDRRKKIYVLTRKGIELAPVLAELVLWAAAHEDTGRQALIQDMREDKAKFLAGLRKDWEKRTFRRN